MSTDKEHLYKVDTAWKEGRTGTISSPGLHDTIQIATPPQFDGGVEGVWSPEHLLVAAVSTCLMTTFSAIAEYSKLSFESLDIAATGKLEKTDGRFMMSQIILKPVLVIASEKHTAKAMRLLEKAEQACLISRSVRSEIILEPEVVVGVPG